MDLNQLTTSLDNDTEMNELENLNGLIDSLDEMVKSDKKLTPRQRLERNQAEWNRPSPFVQQWFPDAVSLRIKIQACRCGSNHAHVEGIFLRSMTRNGATKWTALSKAEMELHSKLPREKDVTEEPVEHCIFCWS